MISHALYMITRRQPRLGGETHAAECTVVGITGAGHFGLWFVDKAVRGKQVLGGVIWDENQSSVVANGSGDD